MDDDTLNQIKAVNPTTIRVYNGDDDYRDVAVQAVRNRWSRVTKTLAALPWSRYELLDKKGGLVGVVENGTLAGEPEALAPSPGNQSVQVRAMMELMLKAQREALTFRDKETSALLSGVVQVMDVMMKGLQATQQMMQAQVDAAHVLAQAQAGGDMDQIVKLVEASPKLLTMLAPLIGKALGSGSPAPARTVVPPPKNGAA